MKRIVLSALVALVASSAFADGYPEDKYRPPVKIDPRPSLRPEPKVMVPGNFPVPKERPPAPVPKQTPRTVIEQPLDLGEKTSIWNFTAGMSLLGGTSGVNAKYAVAGATLNGGWIPVRPVSLNLDLGAVMIHDARPVGTNLPGVHVDKKYNLVRPLARGSLLISPKWGRVEIPFGVYHARALLAPGGESLLNPEKWKNTFRETGGTLGVYVGNIGGAFDVGYNAVNDGFTGKGWIGTLRFNIRFI